MARDFSSRSDTMQVNEKYTNTHFVYCTLYHLLNEVDKVTYQYYLQTKILELYLKELMVICSGCMKDTGLNISTNNISSNIKIDPDKFALKTNKKYMSDQIKTCDQDITL